MAMPLLPLLLGLVAGILRGGRLANIARARFRLPGLVFAGLGLQVGAELIAWLVNHRFRLEGRGLLIVTVSYLLLITFVLANRRLANRRLPGAVLIGVGLALNLAVILANGGMPVSLEAADAAGVDPRSYLRSAVKHRVMGPGTVWGFLGDVIPIPLVQSVVSVGDLVLATGVFLLVEKLVRSYPEPKSDVVVHPGDLSAGPRFPGRTWRRRGV